MINPFVLIVDQDGDAVDIMSDVVVDQVFQVVRNLDKNHPNDAPHKAWKWCGKHEGWKEVRD